MSDEFSYYNPEFKIDDPEKYVITWVQTTPMEGVDLIKTFEQIAAESSIGTWTKICTMNEEIATKLKPAVYDVDENNRTAKIAYPIELFEKNNMAGIMSSICGNIFGMEVLKELRVMDIRFPKSIVESYPGPAFGIEGVRKFFGVKDRPLTGTIIKPKVGLTAKQHAEVGYQAWTGEDGLGLDIVKDDENLTSLEFNTFDERVELTVAMQRKVEKESGEKKGYLCNITHSDYNEMMRRSKLLEEVNGKGEYIMLDVVTLGFSAVHSYRLANTGMMIHAHRAMHAAMTRTPGFSISMLVLAKVYRLLGVDQLHIGTAGVGKMESSEAETVEIGNNIQMDETPENPAQFSLGQKWWGMKPVVSIASGGLGPHRVPEAVERMGKDTVMQAGGGVHGHPRGTAAGATSLRQAVDCAMEGADLIEYGKTHKQLGEALEKWKPKSRVITYDEEANKQVT
ncbi:type III ribulose-bisphosphate carboxylase [Patescibacteria group bacterium]|nr:type III ribulose-bisphosphate carboxylase [Patescibacteria group bacterium]